MAANTLSFRIAITDDASSTLASLQNQIRQVASAATSSASQATAAWQTLPGGASAVARAISPPFQAAGNAISAAMEAGVKSAQAALNGLEATANTVGKGITTSLGAIGTATLGMMGGAGRLESMRDSLGGMAQQWGFSVDELVAKTKAASRNTLSESTIIQGALNALTLIGGEAFKQLGGFENVFPKLAETAKKASRVTAQDAEFMFTSIMLGLGRASPMILDNLGITLKSSEAYDAWAAKMGQAGQAAGLTAEELRDLSLEHNLLTAKIQEETERHRQLIAKWGENGLAVQTHAAQLAKLQADLDDNEKAMAGMGKAAKTSAADLDVTSQKAALLNAFLEKAEQVYGKVAVTSGGLSGAEMKLNVVLSDLKNTIGTQLLPVLTPLVKKLTEIATAAAPRIIEAVGTLVGWFLKLPEPLRLVISGLVALATVTTGAGATLALLGPLMGPLLGIISGLAAPLGLVAGAVIAFAAAWQNNWGGIQQIVAAAWAVIGPALDNIKFGLKIVVEAIQGLLSGKLSFEGFLAQFGVAKTIIGDAIGKILSALGDAAGKIAAKVAEWGKGFVDWIGPKIPAILAGLGSLIGGIVNWIAAQVPVLMAQVAQWAAAFIGWIGPQIPGILAGLGQLGSQILDWIQGQIPAIGGMLSSLWAGIFDKFPAPVQAAITAVQGVFSQLANVVGPVIQNVISFVQNLISSFQGAGSGISPLSGLMNTLHEVLNRLAPTFANIVAGIQGFVTALQPALAPLQQFASLITSTVIPALLQIAAVVGGVVVGAFLGLVNFVAGALPGIGMIISGVVTTAIGIFQTLVGVIQGVVAVVKALITGDWAGAWNAAKQAVQNLANGIANILSGLVQIVMGIIRGLVGGIIALFKGLWGALVGGSIVWDIVNGIVDAFTSLGDKARELWEGLKTAIIEKAQALKEAALEKITALKEAALEKITALKEAALEKITALKEVVVEKVTALKDAAVQLIQDLTDSLKKKWEAIKDQAEELVGKMKEAIEKKAGEIKDAVSTAIANALQSVKDTVKDWVTAGGDLLAGLLKGMQDGLKQVEDLVAAIVGNIIAAVKAFFKIPSSPSGVFMEIGQDVMAGMAQGMQMGTPLVIESLDSLFGLIDRIFGLVQGRAAHLPEHVAKSIDQWTGAAKGIMDAIKSTVETLRAAKDYAAPAAGLMEAVTDTMVQIVEMVRAKVGGISPEIAAAHENVQKWMQATAGIISAITGAAGSLAEAANYAKLNWAKARAGVEGLLLDLAMTMTVIGKWIADHQPAFDQGIAWFQKEVGWRLQVWVDALKPLGELLSLAKGILDVAATETQEVKLAIGQFLGNLAIIMTEVGNWITGHQPAFDRGIAWFQEEVAPRLQAWVEALAPLQSLLSAAKGVLDVAATEAGEVTLDVDRFFANLAGFMDAILATLAYTATAASGGGGGGVLRYQAVVQEFTERLGDFLQEWADSLAPLQNILSVAKGVLEVAGTEVGEMTLSVDQFFHNIAMFMDAILATLAYAATTASGGTPVLRYQSIVQEFTKRLGEFLQNWAAALQPLQSLLSVAKGILEIAATEVLEVRLAVSMFFDNLQGVMLAVYEYVTGPANPAAVVGLFTKEVTDFLAAWAAALQPLSSLLSVTKGILDTAANEVSEVKLAVATFFDNLQGVMLAVYEYVTGPQNPAAVVGLFTKEVTDFLAAWAAALQPIQSLLSVVKGILDTAANEVQEVKLAVDTFLSNVLQMMMDVQAWIGDRAWLATFVNSYSLVIGPTLDAWVKALQPIQGLLQVAKGVLDIAASEVQEVKLAVDTFLGNVLQMMMDVQAWIGDRAWLATFVNSYSLVIGPTLDAWNKALQPIQNLLSVAKGILDTAASETQEVKLAVGVFFGNLLAIMEAVRDYVRDTAGLEAVIAEFEAGIGKTLERWNAALQPMQQLLSTIASSIQSLEQIADWKGVAANVATLAGDIAAVVSAVARAILDALELGSTEFSKADEAAQAWLDKAGGVLSTIANSIKSLQDIAGWKALDADVKALAENITDLLNQVGRAILDAVKNATTSTVWGDAEIAAKTWLEGAGGVLSTVANAIKGLQDVAGWTGVKANASTLAKNITETLNAVADAILGAIGESRKWDDVKKAAADWLSGAGGVVSTVANAIKSILDIAAWTGQIEVAENQFRSITPASVASLAESITNFLITVSKAIVDAIQAAKVTWGDAEKAAADWATGASNVISSISSAAKGMADLAKIDITTSAIATSNVVGGIATAIGWVKAKLETLEPEAVINLCNRAHDILKAIFDLASFKPSEIVDLTVTFDNAKAIGNRAMSGLLFGLTSNMGALAAQVAGVIAALQLPDMYSGGFNAGASLINGIVAGIYAALPNLQAALAYLASLLPHSPAKRGPLSEPVGWAGYLGAGLPQALAGLQQTLGGLAPTLIPAPALIGGGGPGYAPAMAAPTTGGNTMVNLNFAGMNLYGTDEEAARRFGRQIVADLERQGIRIRGR